MRDSWRECNTGLALLRDTSRRSAFSESVMSDDVESQRQRHGEYDHHIPTDSQGNIDVVPYREGDRMQGHCTLKDSRW